MSRSKSYNFEDFGVLKGNKCAKYRKLRRVAEDFGVLRVINVQTIEDFGVLRVINVQHIEDLDVLHVLQPPLRAKMVVMMVSAHHHTQLRAQAPQPHTALLSTLPACLAVTYPVVTDAD